MTMVVRKWMTGVFLAVICCGWAWGAEPGSGEVLAEALRTRQVVTFIYKGQERTVEPHALGKAADDKPALLAWQTSGGSNTEPPPGWRLFIVAEIGGLRVTKETFAKPRDDYRGKARGLKSVEVEVAAGGETSG